MTRLLLLLLLLLSGCVTAPLPYEPPVLWAPAAWRSPLLLTDPVAPEWWRAWDDPALTGLMARVGGNGQVKLATARIPDGRAPTPAETWTRRAAVAQARAAVATAYVKLRAAQARGEPDGLLRNALTWQLGLLPGALDAEVRPAPALAPRPPPRILAGPPAELARRRPDARLAELALAAAGPEDARMAAVTYQLTLLRALTEVDNAALALAAAPDAESRALAAIAVQAALGTGWEPPAGQ